MKLWEIFIEDFFVVFLKRKLDINKILLKKCFLCTIYRVMSSTVLNIQTHYIHLDKSNIFRISYLVLNLRMGIYALMSYVRLVIWRGGGRGSEFTYER